MKDVDLKVVNKEVRVRTTNMEGIVTTRPARHRARATVDMRTFAERLFKDTQFEGAVIEGFGYSFNTDAWIVYFTHPNAPIKPEGEPTEEVELLRQ